MSSTREDDTDNNIYYRVLVILFLGANSNHGENFKTSNRFHFNSKTLAIIQVHFLKTNCALSENTGGSKLDPLK